MKTKVKRGREALFVRPDRVFVLRHLDGRLAVVTVGGIIAPLLFVGQPEADAYRQQILAHSSVPERIRRRQLKEWRVDVLGEQEGSEVMLQTELHRDEVRHTAVFVTLI